MKPWRGSVSCRDFSVARESGGNKQKRPCRIECAWPLFSNRAEQRSALWWSWAELAVRAFVVVARLRMLAAASAIIARFRVLVDAAAIIARLRVLVDAAAVIARLRVLVETAAIVTQLRAPVETAAIITPLDLASGR